MKTYIKIFNRFIAKDTLVGIILLIFYAVGTLQFLNFIAIEIKENNLCPFENAECPNVQKYLKDYQFEYHMDTLRVWDTDKLIGTHVTTDGTINHGMFIDSLILNDNK